LGPQRGDSQDWWLFLPNVGSGPLSRGCLFQAIVAVLGWCSTSSVDFCCFVVFVCRCSLYCVFCFVCWVVGCLLVFVLRISDDCIVVLDEVGCARPVYVCLLCCGCVLGLCSFKRLGSRLFRIPSASWWFSVYLSFCLVCVCFVVFIF